MNIVEWCREHDVWYLKMDIEIPEVCIKLHLGGKLPSDRQLADALKIRDQAYEEGFNFIS